MRRQFGVSGRVFKTLGDHKINVHAIAQGSSELNISFVISSGHLKQAMNALHNEFFFEGRKVWSIYLAGPGKCGSTNSCTHEKQS
jgi:aspartokinase/homoserine dehydrogenase 1